MSDWKPGDRVQIELPYSGPGMGRGRRSALFTGTVTEVDPPGLPRGVRVELDQVINGVSTCYATHAELQPLDVTS